MTGRAAHLRPSDRRIDRLARDVRTLAHLARPRRAAGSHADRLEAFYAPQAGHYDAFRERLLPGRRELVASLPLRPGAVWIDLGGGTGRNLQFAEAVLPDLARVYVVDLSASLLAVAARRVAEAAWSNVSLIEADAARVALPDGTADVVTCSYSLSMMPEWRLVIARARDLLRPGGTIGVVDFHVSAAQAPPGRRQDGWWTRHIWPWWFRQAGVALAPERLACLAETFATVDLVEDVWRLPYLPGSRVPFYRFLGGA
jgi:S-adenosylmethionine-diacylgycerolhomoserine-N-methlytransferase